MPTSRCSKLLVGSTSIRQNVEILRAVSVHSDTFIDVGSKIGQLVTFAAAYSKCAHVSGIEQEQVPADFATENGIQFERLMEHFGEQPRPFKLEKYDFRDEEQRRISEEQSNNYFSQ
ncbi:hypothetical protein L5515_013575 [Caenorhabditis briggsae]|uniref:Histone-lysine N-methyltransferase, H3 lysine-79 specific n=1 Tax=Caenorhabditis briggsae TaxID=6238 RepID=A0AAE9E9K5_CAEBR|nr:hypothetical protein L5515_013575 [Caenorhabditis briggsae]